MMMLTGMTRNFSFWQLMVLGHTCNTLALAVNPGWQPGTTVSGSLPRETYRHVRDKHLVSSRLFCRFGTIQDVCCLNPHVKLT